MRNPFKLISNFKQYNTKILSEHWKKLRSESYFILPLLVTFKKCLSGKIMTEIKEMIIVYNTPKYPEFERWWRKWFQFRMRRTKNLRGYHSVGTWMSHFSFLPPQDVNLLNMIWENHEKGCPYSTVRPWHQFLMAMFLRCFWQNFLLFYTQKCPTNLWMT